ncbi:GPI ethanolamine phosphate transferase 2-like [Scylla paramamosain]|uniref:GPI ethanolamine phosphate transferase 2-like n=1 Tax=Scylla paramamosain TaxID=85552 RepID=UPI003083DA7E
MTGLSPLVVEQCAVVAGLLAYLTGLVTVRPRPAGSPHDTLARYSNDSHMAVEKVVVVVIDALRADHLVTAAAPLMPYLQGQLASGAARGYVVHTAAPTVTLPRIKSLVTGSVPGFMDIIENFGAGELVDDNIIRRWAAQGRRIHLYGDDTWLKVFPSQFSKHQGVTSFFVTDYTEVDRNVTQHLTKVLPSDEWDVLILHYLGLDHIGHLEGPMSPLIGPKLLEMDAVVKNIHVTLEAKGLKYLVLVCGDHGMSDAGGHGGSSHSEVTTSALFLSNTIIKKRPEKVQEARQVDLAPTLGLLTGIGVPEGSVGRPITELLQNIPPEKRMALHSQAARQLLAIAKGSGLHLNHGNVELLFQQTTLLHERIVQDLRQNPAGSRPEVERVCKFYGDCQQEVSDALATRQQSYDLPIIYLATFALLMILAGCVWRQVKGGPLAPRKQVVGTTVGWCAGCTFLGWLLVCAGASGSKMCHLLQPSAWLLFMAFVYVMVALASSSSSSTITRNTHKPADNPGSKDAVHYFLMFGTCLHSLSLLGTSLVEEEHQTLYFFTTTLHLYLIFKIIRFNFQGSGACQGHKSSAYKTTSKEEDTSYLHLPTQVKQENRELSLLEKAYLPQNKILLLLALSLVLSRILRAWNATGDKWRHLEDLGDILRALGGRTLVLVVVAGLVLSFLILLHTSWPLVLIALIAVFGRHYPFLASGTFEAQIAYLAIICLYVYGLFKAKLIDLRAHSKVPKMTEEYDVEDDKMSTLLRYSYTALSLLCLLLQRIDNVGMLSLILLQNWILSRVLYRLALARYLSWEGAAMAISWLAFTHYFNQGNSNSLTTIDMSAGFVGVNSFHPLLHGILIATQTFGGTFLTYLAFLVHLASKDGSKERWQRQLYVWWCVRLATVTLYVLNVLCQRHHLFIWSVFTPKLLYEGAHVLVLCALTLYMWGVEKVCTLLEVTYRFE